MTGHAALIFILLIIICCLSPIAEAAVEEETPSRHYLLSSLDSGFTRHGREDLEQKRAKRQHLSDHNRLARLKNHNQPSCLLCPFYIHSRSKSLIVRCPSTPKTLPVHHDLKSCPVRSTGHNLNSNAMLPASHVADDVSSVTLQDLIAHPVYEATIFWPVPILILEGTLAECNVPMLKMPRMSAITSNNPMVCDLNPHSRQKGSSAKKMEKMGIQKG